MFPWARSASFLLLLIVPCWHQTASGQGLPSGIRTMLTRPGTRNQVFYKFEADTLSDIIYPGQTFRPKRWYVPFKKDLLVHLDGTGKVLAFRPDNSWYRVDSTSLEGYDFGCFSFSYRDTLYSLGGYGYWNFNGMLRAFQEKTHQWELIRTNKLVPLYLRGGSQVYFDEQAGKVYVMYKLPEPEATIPDKETDRNIYLQCLDLNTKYWWSSPKLVGKDVLSDLEWITNAMFNTPYGLLVLSGRTGIYVLDFIHDRYGVVKPDKARHLKNIWDGNSQLILTATDSMLFTLNPSTGSTDSVSISGDDLIFEKTGFYAEQRVVDPVDRNKLLRILAPILLLMVVGVGAYLLGRSSKRKSGQSDTVIPVEDPIPTSTAGEAPKHFVDTLTEVEKGLLGLLLKNGKSNMMTGVLQVNEVLGLARKDVKVQNNIRSTTIQTINLKFRTFSGLQDDLIQKQRTNFDKRFYEYYIHQRFLAKVSK